MRRPLALVAAVSAALLGAIGLLALGTGAAQAAPVALKPGTIFADTAGARLQAHGAGVFKVGSTYYMVGEDKKNGNLFSAVACYSSQDLVNWTRQADALTPQSSGDLTTSRIVERPKVIYNDATKLYVMWMHIDQPGYPDGRAGVATSKTPCGPYTYQGSSRPLGDLSKDLGLFKDTDGSAYLLREDRAHGLRIDKLADDYRSVKSAVAVFTDLESPTMVKVNGRYFLFASNLTGWRTNDNVYMTATSLAGPWSAPRTFAPVGSNTFNSQTSFVLPVTGTAGTSYLFIGDRWNSSDLYSSSQVWLPLTISGSTASMNTWYDSWSIDAAAGTWKGGATSHRLLGQPSGRCLDVPKESTTNGALLQIWDCVSSSGQQWVSQSNGELRVYGNKCLDVPKHATTPGSPVEIWDCTGGDNQKWTLNSDGTVVGQESGLCLEVSKEKTANGSAVDLWTCNGKAHQKWTYS